ncbi:unnamed protein product [Phytophthora fragariaefolia]|uniref:Unnamed protein product n=1 Tax=Phytophthora fragariaefolia TaxID=1490495 RepID=A0A9W6Y311_9STRA|nr:unnamed protein product [Phytophthora fragariaefolia]
MYPLVLPHYAILQLLKPSKLPDDHEVRVPDNTTFRQLQHIDRLEDKSNNIITDQEEYAPVLVLLNDSPATL